jgi:hypothetical protein
MLWPISLHSHPRSLIATYKLTHELDASGNHEVIFENIACMNCNPAWELRQHHNCPNVAFKTG